MAADTTYFHPLVNDQELAIAPANPLRFLEAGAQHPRTLDLFLCARETRLKIDAAGLVSSERKAILAL